MSYGITTLRIKHLPYLDYSNEAFLTPYEAGCRMLILYTVAYLCHHLDERLQASAWLKEEKLWGSVSPSEKEFFDSESVAQQKLDALSWRVEGALALGWCVGCLQTLPRLDADNDDEVISEFENNIPAIGDSTMLFLTKLEFRSLEEIYEETLLNELATTYFRDLLFNGRFDTSQINRHISFERHQALNWLRSFGWIDRHENPGEFWDEVDTST